MNAKLALVASVTLLAGLSSCGSDQPAADNPAKVLSVVTTTTQVSDFAANVGGDDVRIYPVLKANVDPHDYEPTPADLDAIAKADVIVINGVGLEGWFQSTIASAEPKGTIVTASDGVVVRAGDGSAEESAGDPHVWHDPRNATIMVGNIATAFARARPEATARFEQRRVAYAAQLDALDGEIAAQVATLTNRKLVTNHDAFGYYVDRYGLDFVGSVIPSFDTQAELSPTDINDLVARIRAEGVTAIFSESSLPPKTAAAIAGEAGVKVVAGEDSLYGDTLGPPGSDGATYLQMERHNTREIVTNLK